MRSVRRAQDNAGDGALSSVDSRHCFSDSGVQAFGLPFHPTTRTHTARVRQESPMKILPHVTLTPCRRAARFMRTESADSGVERERQRSRALGMPSPLAPAHAYVQQGMYSIEVQNASTASTSFQHIPYWRKGLHVAMRIRLILRRHAATRHAAAEGEGSGAQTAFFQARRRRVLRSEADTAMSAGNRRDEPAAHRTLPSSPLAPRLPRQVLRRETR